MEIILIWRFISPPEHSFIIRKQKKEYYFVPFRIDDEFNTGGWFHYGTWGTWTRIKS